MTKKKSFLVVVFAVVLLIPIIYSFFYLKSYWDPYGNLTDMKIAVVNLDEGMDGENQGKEFLDELIEDGTFNICSVSKDVAENGLQSGEYQAVITVPSNFTSSLKSADTENKQIATITYTPNKAYNYLGTQIVNSAMKTIELNLRSKVSKEVVSTLSDNIGDIPDSLQDISDGTQKLLDGTQELSNGLNDINNGVTELKTKYKDFDNGVLSAYNGSIVLTDGINQINTGSGSLDSGLQLIQNGVNELNAKGTAGVNELVSGIDALHAGTQALVQGTSSQSSLAQGASMVSQGVASVGTTLVSQVNASEAALLQSAGFTSIDQVNATKTQLEMAVKNNIDFENNLAKLESVNQLLGAVSALESTKSSISASASSGSLKTLSDGAAALSTGITTLNSKATELDAGAAKLASAETKQSLSTLVSGITQLQSGINDAKAGTSKLKDGASQASTGSETLKQGLYTLKTSSTTVSTALDTLNSGTKSAYDGSLDVIDGIKELKTGVDDGIVDAKAQVGKLNGLDDFVEEPVNFEEESYGEVDSYGLSFLPLFLCIGLWVGSLMCYVVFYYDQKRRFGVLDSKYENKFKQNAMYILIGAVEGLITSFLLKAGLGFNPVNIPLYYIVSMIIGMVFMSILQFLIRNFGDVGKLLGLIILVLQLCASGGTFPIETIDKGFRVISPYLPMTYSIKLLKELTISSDMNNKVKYISILLTVGIICYVLTNIIDILKNKKSKEDNSEKTIENKDNEKNDLNSEKTQS